MYGKHFAQTYTGSMFGAGPVVFAVWGYVIATARRDGTVELNPQLLAATFGCPPDEVDGALGVLTAPDPHSRSKAHDGRRLLPLGEFLYQVPSYQRFNSMKSDDERRAYNRLKQQESRARKDAVKAPVKKRQSMSATEGVSVPVPVPVEATTTLVGLKPNGKAVARTYQAIQAHLAETLALVKDGQLERLAADEMRGIQAELVFAYWQAKCGHERALLDDKRLTRLKRCLHENGGNVHELLYAVDGWAKDATFQRLADQDNRTLDGIDNIFRDRERIERLAGHSKPWRTEQAPHPMALKYLEGADVPAHQ